ncbi:hypothetical protein Aab01nite_46010 [Paractinoplanes abujensis]|uniref:Uncharacterized protein n=1 Tax=Paractinoplanes abujensis TaxID=882441 RepID=A0A7W7FXS5_9ACTN|nr:hypothetical protein [Actinoplanes abujensis]MBB4690248.1 hypothetical protein [Actinoplanes abujensis]GID21011.1 hypothetical protein Aab01nite_46010 [Actinoplanes abujensis]
MRVGRAEATEGVDQRLETTLHAYPGLRLEKIPASQLKPPPTREGVRVLRGGRLPGLDELTDEVYATIRELWEQSGCRIEGYGRTLVVHDPAGYVITLTQQPGDDPVLTVASPPVPARLIDPPLLAGLLGGLTLGCAGPCSAVGPMTLFPSLAGWSAPYWGWIPLYLLIGAGSVWRPETRRFGAGLLVSGGLVGVAVAWVLS